MGLVLSVNDKDVMGISYGHFSGLVNEICEYLYERCKDDESVRDNLDAVHRLENYTIYGNFCLSASDCQKLFNLMSDEEIGLENHIHCTYEADIDYPYSRLSRIGSRMTYGWNSNHVVTGTMNELDMNMIKDFYNGDNPKRSDYIDRLYLNAIDYLVEKMCCVNDPICFSFEEPERGLEDRTLGKFIQVLAMGAMSGKGVYFL